MRAAFLATLSLFSTLISAQQLTTTQATNLFAANTLLLGQLISTVLENINNTDPNLSLFTGAENVFETFFTDALFGNPNDSCTFNLANLIPSTDPKALVGSLAYVSALSGLGAQSLLNTSGLNLTDADSETLQNTFFFASTLAAMAGAVNGLPANATSDLPNLAPFEYQQMIKQFSPNCSLDLGLDDPSISGIRDIDFNSPFDLLIGTTSNFTGFCPSGRDCSCHVITSNPDIPDRVSPAGACVLISTPGMNLVILTTDDTPLSQDADQRAQSEGSYVAGPTGLFGF